MHLLKYIVCSYFLQHFHDGKQIIFCNSLLYFTQQSFNRHTLTLRVICFMKVPEVF